MTIEIWKYTLAVKHSQVVEMPKHAKLLTVQVNLGEPCVWAAVNTQETYEKRVLITYGTGHPVQEITLFPFLGTYQLEQADLPFPLVFHVFDGGVAA